MGIFSQIFGSLTIGLQSAQFAPSAVDGNPALLSPVRGDWYEAGAPENSYNPYLSVGFSGLLILELGTTPAHGNLVGHIARLSAEEMAENLRAPTRPEIVLKTGDLLSVTEDQLRDYDGYSVINYSTAIGADNISNLVYGARDPYTVFNGQLTNPIIVQGIGNHGNSNGPLNEGKFDRDTADSVQFYPYAIQVGEVTNTQGVMTADQHSARSGPFIVAQNMTETGQAPYRYKDVASLTPEERSYYEVDENGYFTAIQGTSFTTPNVSGALAQAKEIYPDMSNSEVLATLAGAGRLPNDVKPSFTSDTLPYEALQWGYGVFDHKLFGENLMAMNALKQDKPGLKDTNERIVDFEVSQTNRGGTDYNVHSFKVDADFTATKVTFASIMPVKVRPPDHFIVVSPTGEERFVPSSVGQTASLTTEAFLGVDSKGTWQIMMPAPAMAVTPDSKDSLFAMQYDPKTGENFNGGGVLTVHGQEKGPDGESNISRLIQAVHENRGLEPAAQPTMAPTPQKAHTP